MPRLVELRIENFRNLLSVELQPSPGINLIFGENGSGKTSLLEAISVLAHGRSFRTHKFRRLINDQEAETTVYSRMQSSRNGELKVGVNRKRNGESTFRVNGRNISSAAELASQLPLLVMDAHSFSLIEGSARVRRQFFDWLVFHVKHEFKDLWKAYSLCVKQRNTLLRRDKISPLELRPWDHELVELSTAIEIQRKQVLAPFLDAFSDTASQFGFNHKEITLSYVNGWKEATASLAQLDATFDKDRKQGFTSLGPHKSDLKITLGQVPAAELLSRGQQKLLIAALFLAEARIKQHQQEEEVVFLMDDLPAELDARHLTKLTGWLNELNAQLFVTGVTAEGLQDLWPGFKDLNHAMFHVKHGEIRQVAPA